MEEQKMTPELFSNSRTSFIAAPTKKSPFYFVEKKYDTAHKACFDWKYALKRDTWHEERFFLGGSYWSTSELSDLSLIIMIFQTAEVAYTRVLGVGYGRVLG